MIPPRFIVPKASLPSSAPSSARSSMMSALASTPSHARARQRHHQRLERAPPVGHRERLAGHAEHPARGVVGGDDEQPAVGQQRPAHGACAAARAPRCGLLGAQRAIEVQPARRHPSTASMILLEYGMSSAHIRREATIAPGGVAGPHAAHDVPARQQAVTERAAEGVAGTEAADDLDRIRRDLLAHAVGGGDEHTVAAHLHDRRREPARQQLRRRRGRDRTRRPPPRTRRGCRSPSSRDRAPGRARRWRRPATRQNCGRQSRSSTVWRAPRSPAEQVVDRRAARLGRQARRSGTRGSAPTRRRRGRRRRSRSSCRAPAATR